jgi:antitoxin component HigA of HigAB toxin-antitoxin module
MAKLLLLSGSFDQRMTFSYSVHPFQRADNKVCGETLAECVSAFQLAAWRVQFPNEVRVIRTYVQRDDRLKCLAMHIHSQTRAI